MKKTLMMTLMGSAVLMSSCGSYTGQGAYVGGSMGTVMGSAVGGLAGGWQGSSIGTIVGMAGGAAVGAAVGADADRRRAEDYDRYQRDRARRQGQSRYDNRGNGQVNGGENRSYGGSGYYGDLNGVDAVYENGEVYEVRNATMYESPVEIRNIRFADQSRDAILQGGEECTVTFDLINRTAQPLRDVQPLVYDLSQNKHITISPNLYIENIAAKSGVRYKAVIVADEKLKDGELMIRISVSQGDREYRSQARDFTVQTQRALKKK